MRIKLVDMSKELTIEEQAEIEMAGNMPIVYDEDCPKTTEAMLCEFHRLKEPLKREIDK